MAIAESRLIIFYLVTGLYWFSMYTYVPVLAPYAQSLGATPEFVGVILGSYGVTQMFLRIPLGIWSDKFNRRKLFIIAGLLFAAVSALGMWLLPNPAVLLACRALSGVAAACWVIYTVLFASYFPTGSAPKAIGFINSVCSTGQVTAMFLGGLAAQYWGIPSVFLLAGGGAVLGLLLTLGVRENSQINRRPLDLSGVLAIGREPLLLRVSLLAVFVQLLTYATVFGFTPVAAKAIGASNFELGMLTTLSILPAILAAALSGTFFSGRLGERYTLVLAFGLSAASVVVIPFITNLSVLYGTQIVGGFGRGLALPLLMGLSIKNRPNEQRATAMGFFQAIYGAGMFLGPLLVGLLSGSMGLSWGFWVVGLIGLMGAVLALWFVPAMGAFIQKSA